MMSKSQLESFDNGLNNNGKKETERIAHRWQNTAKRAQVAHHPTIANVSQLYYSFERFPRNAPPVISPYDGIANRDSLGTPDPEVEEDTQVSLSWKRLHLARAKLKATSTTSEILAAFALITMVELQINYPTKVPEWLFVMFSVSTTVLVSTLTFALMISNYLLPSIETVSKFKSPLVLAESPHEEMKRFIEVAWILAHIVGLTMFLLQLGILCWIKYYDYSFNAPLSATILLIPILFIFIGFALYFYRILVGMKWKSSISNIQELEDMSHSLDSMA